jgi:hypothetical protein
MRSRECVASSPIVAADIGPRVVEVGGVYPALPDTRVGLGWLRVPDAQYVDRALRRSHCPPRRGRKADGSTGARPPLNGRSERQLGDVYCVASSDEAGTAELSSRREVISSTSPNRLDGRRLRRAAANWWAIPVIGVIVTVAAATQPYPNGPSIRADGTGYHLWTRAILEHDLTFCRYRELETLGAIAARDVERNVCLNKYPPGLALLRFPAMAPLVDRSRGAPLISEAEHHANATFSALALVLTAVLILASAYRLGATPMRSNVAVLAAVFGTGLFHYATYDGSFTHVYGALGVSLLVWLGLHLRPLGLPSWLTSVLVGGVCFFLVSIRPMHVFIVATFALVYLGQRWSAGALLRFLWLDRALIAAATGSLLAGGLQVGYIYWATGRVSLSSYGEEGFLLDRPMQAAVFFSYEKGLLVWYPVIALLVGAALIVRETRWAALMVIVLVLAYGTVYGFWYSWLLGSGFGHRGFVDLVPLTAIVGAVALSRLSRPAAVGSIAVMVLLAAGTVSLMLGYWRGTIPLHGTDLATFRDHLIGNESILTP